MEEDRLEVLFQKVNELEKRITNIEKKFSSDPEISNMETPIKQKSLDEKAAKLAEDANITLEKLQSILYFNLKDITLLVSFEGKNEFEKQIEATLVILTSSAYLYDKEEIASIELKSKLKNLGIKSLIDLSTNISKCKRDIIREGKRGSHNYRYKLTVPGKNKGLKIIHKLAYSNDVK